MARTSLLTASEQYHFTANTVRVGTFVSCVPSSEPPVESKLGLLSVRLRSASHSLFGCDREGRGVCVWCTRLRRIGGAGVTNRRARQADVRVLLSVLLGVKKAVSTVAQQ